jgi:hypothetical protein
VVGQRHSGVTIVLADKSPFLPKTHPDEARVADDDRLQIQQLVQIDRSAASFTYSASPALDAVLGCTFSFNCVTGF